MLVDIQSLRDACCFFPVAILPNCGEEISMSAQGSGSWVSDKAGGTGSPTQRPGSWDQLNRLAVSDVQLSMKSLVQAIELHAAKVLVAAVLGLSIWPITVLMKQQESIVTNTQRLLLIEAWRDERNVALDKMADSLKRIEMDFAVFKSEREIMTKMLVEIKAQLNLVHEQGRK